MKITKEHVGKLIYKKEWNNRQPLRIIFVSEQTIVWENTENGEESACALKLWDFDDWQLYEEPKCKTLKELCIKKNCNHDYCPAGNEIYRCSKCGFVCHLTDIPPWKKVSSLAQQQKNWEQMEKDFFKNNPDLWKTDQISPEQPKECEQKKTVRMAPALLENKHNIGEFIVTQSVFSCEERAKNKFKVSPWTFIKWPASENLFVEVENGLVELCDQFKFDWEIDN